MAIARVSSLQNNDAPWLSAYAENFKNHFLGAICGNMASRPSEIERDVLHQIRHVRAAVEDNTLDSDIADYVLRALVADMINIMLTKSLEKLSSHECRRATARQLVLPGI